MRKLIVAVLFMASFSAISAPHKVHKVHKAKHGIGYKHHARIVHPVLATLGVAIILNELGKPVADNGQEVIIVGNKSGEIDNIYEAEGKLIIVKK